MHIKKSDALNLFGYLSAIYGNQYGIHYTYAVMKNKSKLKQEADVIEETKKKLLGEFENKRTELCEQHADKDEAGKVIMDKVPNSPMKTYRGLGKSNVAFSDAFKKLKTEFAKPLDEWESFLSSETEISLHKVKFEQLPDKLSSAEMEILTPMIDMDETED